MNFNIFEPISSKSDISDDTRSNYIELVHGRMLLSLFSLFTEGETAMALRRLVFHGFSMGRNSPRNHTDLAIVKNALLQWRDEGGTVYCEYVERALEAIQALGQEK